MAAPKKTETLLNQLKEIANDLERRSDDLTLADRAAIAFHIDTLEKVAHRRPPPRRGKMWR